MHVLLLKDVSVPTGNQISNTTTPTSFAWSIPWPANTDTLANAHRTFKIKGFGSLSSAASGQGTLTLKFLWGSTALAATAAISMPASLNSAGWTLDAILRVCSTGTSGKISAQGFFILDNAGVSVSAGMVNAGTGTSGQITINTQNAASPGIQLQSTFSAASASNIITLLDMVIEEIA